MLRIWIITWLARLFLEPLLVHCSNKTSHKSGGASLARLFCLIKLVGCYEERQMSWKIRYIKHKYTERTYLLPVAHCVRYSPYDSTTYIAFEYTPIIHMVQKWRWIQNRLHEPRNCGCVGITNIVSSFYVTCFYIHDCSCHGYQDCSWFLC